jgi:hypothetical protein
MSKFIVRVKDESVALLREKDFVLIYSDENLGKG